MFEITILNDLILYGGVLLSIPLIVVYVMCMSNEFVRTIYSQNLFFFFSIWSGLCSYCIHARASAQDGRFVWTIKNSAGHIGCIQVIASVLCFMYSILVTADDIAPFSKRIMCTCNWLYQLLGCHVGSRCIASAFQ